MSSHGEEDAGAQGGQQLEQITPRTPTLPSQFPDRLMMLLESRTAPDALWWLPDAGTIKGAFAINRKVFTTAKISDTAFNGNKWPSITRNLNRWGYRHVAYPNLPPHTTAYHNPHFQPNRPDLLQIMTHNKPQAKAAIQQAEMKETSSPSPLPSIHMPGRRGVGIHSAASVSSEQLSSSSQLTLLNSLSMASLSASDATSQSRLPQLPPGPPLVADRLLIHQGNRQTGSPPTQQRYLTSSAQNTMMENTANDSSSAFELFPNQQLQDVLLPNMASNLDSQAMLQSILSRQEGFDALDQSQTSFHMPASLQASDSAMLQQQLQLQHLEALLGMQPSQPQTQLFNAQEQEQQQDLMTQFHQPQYLQPANSVAQPPQPSLQSGFMYPQSQPPFLSLSQQQQQQQQQQQGQSNIPPENAYDLSSSWQMQQQQQQHLQLLMNAPTGAPSLSLFNPNPISGGTMQDAMATRLDAFHQPMPHLQQQQEAFFNELMCRRRQQQGNSQPESPPGGDEDCKTS